MISEIITVRSSFVMSSSSLKKWLCRSGVTTKRHMYQVAMLRVWCDVYCDCDAAGVRLPVASGYIIPCISVNYKRISGSVSYQIIIPK